MYKLSAKVNGKWFTFGNLKNNQYGNLQLGIKITPEFLAFVEAAKEKGWLNLSAFEDNGEKKEYKPQQEKPSLNDEIPFD